MVVGSPPRCRSTNQSFCNTGENRNGLKPPASDGKICRKALGLLVKTRVSCRFSSDSLPKSKPSIHKLPVVRLDDSHIAPAGYAHRLGHPTFGFGDVGFPQVGHTFLILTWLTALKASHWWKSWPIYQARRYCSKNTTKVKRLELSYELLSLFVECLT